MATLKSPDNFGALFFTALCQKSMGQEQNARTTYIKCLEIDPKSADALYNLGNMYAKRSPKLAVQYYT
jgi:Tfp pilus assembly protein PilF